jgi:hypothetical protein
MGTPGSGVPPCPSTALGVLSLSKDIWTFLSSLGKSDYFRNCVRVTKKNYDLGAA